MGEENSDELMLLASCGRFRPLKAVCLCDGPRHAAESTLEEGAPVLLDGAGLVAG